MSAVERKSTAIVQHAFLPVCRTSKISAGSKKYSVSYRILSWTFHQHGSSEFRYEEVLINLSDQPAWYLAKNSAAEVPLLEWIDEKTKAVRSIPESLVVCDYLEDLYPEPRLHSSDPFERAQQKVLISRLGNVKQSNLYFFIFIKHWWISFSFLSGSVWILCIYLRWWKRCRWKSKQ